MLGKLLLAGLIFASPITTANPIDYDEPVVAEEATEETSEEVEVEVSESESTTLVDSDNNGIPDVIEDYYDSHIRDQYMFGIGLGALIGLLTSIVSAMFMISRNIKSVKLIENTNKAHNEIVDKFKSEVQAYKELLAEEKIELLAKVKENQELVDRVNKYHDDKTKELENFMNLKLAEMQQQTETNIQAFKESSELLDDYAQIETKIQALLESIKELSLSSDNVKEGISEKVFKIVEEATKYE